MKNLIERQFSKSIGTYDEAAIVQRKIANHLSDQIQLIRKEFEKIYEIGAGTGLSTYFLLDKLSINQFIINDLCLDMQKPISEVFETHPEQTWTFLAGNAEYLPIPSGVDLVVSSSSFQWFSDFELFLKKAGKSLKSDAILAFSTFGPKNMYECKAVTGAGLHYPDPESIDRAMEPYFETLYQSGEEISLWFDSPLEVLIHMKLTGVNSLGNGTPTFDDSKTAEKIWTPAKLRNFENVYQKEFEDNGKYPLTYHPIYRIGLRKK